MSEVSAIVPAYNAAATLGETLGSIAAQTLPPWETIVVDDGSTDDTGAILASYGGTRLIRQANAGPSAAINRGVAAASGEWLAILDADDLWTPAALATHLGAPESARADIVVGYVEEFRDDPRDELLVTRPPVPGWLAGATLFRRQLWMKLGGMAADLRVGGWVDLMDRARRHGAHVVQHDNVVLRRRIRHGTLSTSPQRNADWLLMAQRAIKRRRDGQ
jgi:glycosyltransferase involved in cell wall biosynthesis